ncbi:hydroxymethylglutaryl-CoA lyase [Micromonospora sp. B11E3]|uniref:hydroxymethylglutaryl-CoA lyase n=1 Tax=Micromonospora sp. B11E3 TaxID=3153562 RepID=UPI00325D733B
MNLPSVVAQPGMPDAVRIYEVGPRDGLQAEKHLVATDVKLEFIRRLLAAGLQTIELTSFVSPKWVPQLADAADVVAGVDLDSARHPVLVANERGLDRALASGVREIAVFASATESFAKNNLNRSVDEALTMFEPVVRRSRDAGVAVRGYISMCFGDPWEGPVALAKVVHVAERLIDMGATSLSLGDTIGVGTPGHVLALVERLEAARIPRGVLAMHFHDTYGQALANVHAALTAGITEFDASAGGIGGCPYAQSATGNLATEDLVWMLTGLGYQTGVNLEQLVEASVWMANHLGRPSSSRVVRAMASTDDRGQA